MCVCETCLIHDVNKPLGVGRKALRQLADSLDDICLQDFISGGPEVVQHFLHNDLQQAKSQMPRSASGFGTTSKEEQANSPCKGLTYL